MIGFSQCQYSFQEKNESFVQIEVLEGGLEFSVPVRVTSADGTATGKHAVSVRLVPGNFSQRISQQECICNFLNFSPTRLL